jgi:cellulose synthase/poly-beta-1,6-N-acetylglucosamine synthase-like glycosyltransferase
LSLGPLEIALIAAYCGIFLLLAIYGAHRYWLVRQYFRHQSRAAREAPPTEDLPTVLVQLPIYNERGVAERLLRAVAAFDYPRDRLAIQVLDDSDDDTTLILAAVVADLRETGVPIEHLRRRERRGYKAGALAWGLRRSDAELVAIFDADFVPPADFLPRAVGHFADPQVGLVQARWEHLNESHSLLTRLQALMLDGHFIIEHGARARSSVFFNFNGTAGVWRRAAIDAAGGWSADTLTEDLDLSFRAQLAGWRFVLRIDLTAPAQLPESILAFKSQQRRWTLGATQTARKLLGPIWRAPIRLACKIEATMQLTCNLAYVLLVALALLLFPVYAARDRFGADWIFWVDIPMLLFGAGALVAFYGSARRELGRSPWGALLAVPALMALGMGMSVNNAWAAVEGIFARGGEFVRTPKRGYAARRQRALPLVEWSLLVHLLATAVFCAARGLWWTFPFLALFIGGFGWVCAMTIDELGWFEGARSESDAAASTGASHFGASRSK